MYEQTHFLVVTMIQEFGFSALYSLLTDMEYLILFLFIFYRLNIISAALKYFHKQKILFFAIFFYAFSMLFLISQKQKMQLLALSLF